MKTYIQPSLTIINMESTEMLCLSVQKGAADNSTVLNQHKNSWRSDIWSTDEEEK